MYKRQTLDKARAKPAGEGVLSAGGGGSGKPGRRPFMERLADMQKQALEQKEAQQRARQALPPGDADRGKKSPDAPASGSAQGPSSNGGPKTPGKASPCLLYTSRCV